MVNYYIFKEIRALGSAVERFPDKKEVPGSTPGAPTSTSTSF